MLACYTALWEDWKCFSLFIIFYSYCVLACYTTLWEDWRFLLPTSKHDECVILPCCCPKDGSGHCTTEYVCKAKVFGNNVSVIVWEKYVEVKSCKVYEAFRGDCTSWCLLGGHMQFSYWALVAQTVSLSFLYQWVLCLCKINPEYQLSCHLSLARLLQAVQHTIIWQAAYLFLTMWKLSW